MSVIFPAEGEYPILRGWVQGNVLGWPARIRLFKNDIAIDEDTVFGDFLRADAMTPEYHGFDGGTWQFPGQVGGAEKAVYGTEALQWENETAEPQTVYGYWVENEDGDKVLFAERFDEPIEVAPGGIVQVWPVVTVASRY